MKLKLLILLGLVVANVGLLQAQDDPDCNKASGCVEQYFMNQWTRSCSGFYTCYVTECWEKCTNSPYYDTFNDLCDQLWFGCYDQPGPV